MLFSGFDYRWIAREIVTTHGQISLSAAWRVHRARRWIEPYFRSQPFGYTSRASNAETKVQIVFLFLKRPPPVVYAPFVFRWRDVETIKCRVKTVMLREYPTFLPEVYCLGGITEKPKRDRSIEAFCKGAASDFLYDTLLDFIYEYRTKFAGSLARVLLTSHKLLRGVWESREVLEDFLFESIEYFASNIEAPMDRNFSFVPKYLKVKRGVPVIFDLRSFIGAKGVSTALSMMKSGYVDRVDDVDITKHDRVFLTFDYIDLGLAKKVLKKLFRGYYMAGIHIPSCDVCCLVLTKKKLFHVKEISQMRVT